MSELGDWKIALDRAKQNNHIAKSEGNLIGRLISLQSMDGYAYYVVTHKDNDNKYYHLKLLEYGYSYTDVIIELFGRKLPVEIVEKYFRIKDANDKRWGID